MADGILSPHLKDGLTELPVNKNAKFEGLDLYNSDPSMKISLHTKTFLNERYIKLRLATDRELAVTNNNLVDEQKTKYLELEESAHPLRAQNNWASIRNAVQDIRLETPSSAFHIKRGADAANLSVSNNPCKDARSSEPASGRGSRHRPRSRTGKGLGKGKEKTQTSTAGPAPPSGPPPNFNNPNNPTRGSQALQRMQQRGHKVSDDVGGRKGSTICINWYGDISKGAVPGSGHCKFGAACDFAHGPDDARAFIAPEKRYVWVGGHVESVRQEGWVPGYGGRHNRLSVPVGLARLWRG